MLVIVARKNANITNVFLKSLYKETYEKFSITCISSIERLELILSEHTIKKMETPILIFIGNYLFTKNENSISSKDIIYYLKKRKSAIVVELSVNFKRFDVNNLQIPDDIKSHDIVAGILEMKNLDEIVKNKNLPLFKKEVNKIAKNIYSHDAIGTKTATNHS